MDAKKEAAKIKWAKRKETLEKAYEKWGGKPLRGRPRLGGPGSKTVLFNIRVTAAMRAQLKPIPAPLIREILGRAILRHANETAYRDGQAGSQGLEPQDQAPAAAQGSPRPQDRPASGPPAAQAAPGPVKIGWAAGRSSCPDTETLFIE